MTRQAYDEFYVEDRSYILSAFTGRGIFRPQDYGLSPRMLHTGCSRGFQCCYSVEHGWLYLRHLTIGVDEPMWLLGGMPLPDEGADWQVYEDLPEPVPFTGGILAARHERGVVQAPFDDLAIESLVPFRLLDGLCELLFEEGMLQDVADRSAAVAGLVESIRLGGGVPPKEEIEAWLGAEFTGRGYVNYRSWLYGEV